MWIIPERVFWSANNKERTGHRSVEALHKYKRTSSEQQFDVSMTLLNKETIPKETKSVLPDFDDGDDDDFQPLKKKPKLSREELSSMFSRASMKTVPSISTFPSDKLI